MGQAFTAPRLNDQQNWNTCNGSAFVHPDVPTAGPLLVEAIGATGNGAYYAAGSLCNGCIWTDTCGAASSGTSSVSRLRQRGQAASWWGFATSWSKQERHVACWHWKITH